MGCNYDVDVMMDEDSFERLVGRLHSREGEFRFIGLAQTGRNCKGHGVLLLGAVELFGMLSGEIQL
jgi:hypothetical protein